MSKWNVKEVIQKDKPTENITQQLYSIEQLYCFGSLSAAVLLLKRAKYFTRKVQTELNGELI